MNLLTFLKHADGAVTETIAVDERVSISPGQILKWLLLSTDSPALIHIKILLGRGGKSYYCKCHLSTDVSNTSPLHTVISFSKY